MLIVDSDGTGTAAKSEVAAMEKGIKKIPGVSNVVITVSGRPLNASSTDIKFSTILYNIIFDTYILKERTLSQRLPLSPLLCVNAAR